MSDLLRCPIPTPKTLQSPNHKASHSSLFSPAVPSRSYHPISAAGLSLAGNGFRRHSKRVSGRSPVLSKNHRRLFGVRCGGKDDAFYMRRCVELAKKAVGCTSPNPMVGCVIVKDGEIVGEGFHPKAGQPHAEVFALKDAGVLAENATTFVTLEPCNHYGRTPPCTEALIRAKVKRVVVGMVDPNPIVASKGVERLRESGIDVVVGVEETLCRKLNEAYIHRMTTGKPFLTLRYSLSFNGRILNKLGKEAEESGGYISQLMQEYDGVLISSNSITSTSTLPTSRETGANQPLQIIIARGASSSLHLPSFTEESLAKTIILADDTISVEPKLAGVEVAVLGQLKLSSILDYCANRGLCSILLDFRGDCQGLSELLEDGFEEHLVQKVVMEVCPIWYASDSVSFLRTSVLAFGGKSFNLKDLESRTSNDSIVVEGYIL